MEKVYEIIKQSLDTCTRMTEASKVDEATRVANKIVKLKDNPVPSLDSELVHILSTFVEMFTDDEEDERNNKVYLDYAKNLLQNGVENE
jgi:streptomycin 6-kinase